MLFMNRYEVEDAADRYRNHPVLGKATRFLREFMREVDEHSDGWAYWSLPLKAAKQMMQLIQSPATATDAGLKKALSPIKSFYTRRGFAAGMKMPTLQ